MNRKKVICEICGKEISTSNIAKHLKSHETHPEYHKPEKGKYALDHDGLICQFCGVEKPNRNSLCNHERLCKKNPNRQELEYKGFATYNANHSSWNRGLTAETDDRVARNVEAVKESYASGKAKARRGQDNPSTRQEVKDKISESCLKKSAEGTWHVSLAKNMHINYNGVDLHGHWELGYAKYLDANNIKWRRCSDRFPYEWDGKTHYYKPDFYIVDSDTYVEIKGYETKKDRAKWSQFPKNENLVILKFQELFDLGIIDKNGSLLQ